MNRTESNDVNKGSIASRAIAGGTLIFAGRMVAKALDVVVLLIVARLLTQETFGLVGLAMTFVVVFEAVLDIQLNQVLLKESRIEPDMLNTVFTLSVCRGLILSLALCCISYPLALVYDDLRLVPLVATLSLAPAFRGARSPAMVFYLKKMDFRWDVVLEVLGKFVGGVVCVFLALLLRNHWALVAGVVLPPLVMNLVSYIVAPHKPQITFSEWHRFSQFTGWMTVSQIARALSWQTDKLLLGYLLPSASFGRYSVAKDLSNTSQQAIVPPILKPLVAACSEARDRSSDLGPFYLKACSAIFLLLGPVFLTLGILAEEVVVVVLGVEWIESGWILRWLSFSALVAAIHRPAESLAVILNRNRDLAIRALCAIAVRLPMIAVGSVFYSYQGAVFALLFSECIAFLLMTNLGCAFCGIRFRELLNALKGTAASLTLMTAVMVSLKPEYSPNVDMVSLVIQLIVCAGISVSTYMVAVLLFWRLEGSPAGIQNLLFRKLLMVFRSSVKTT